MGADLAKVVDSLHRLYGSVGFSGCLALCVLVIVATFGRMIYKDRRAERAYDRLIKAQENEISRLADDNRAWRDRYFLSTGTSEAAIMALDANEDERTNGERKRRR